MNDLFEIENDVWDLLLRGTILYIVILLIMRVLPRRTGGEMAVMDLVFILLITEAAAHSLGDYASITEGLIIIGTIVFWNYLVNVTSYHVPFIENLVSSPPVQIIRNGHLLRKNMRSEYLTEEELIGHLRKEGVEDIVTIKKAFIESDGTITVIKRS